MRRAINFYCIAAAALVIFSAASILLGQANLADPSLRTTLIELRATRVAAAFLAGATLAVGGAWVQGLFRNPLVSPSILGTTAGAQLGGQLALLSFPLWPAVIRQEFVLPAGALLGAAVALAIVLIFCRGNSSPLTLILTGFILSSLFLSIGGFVMSLAQDTWEVGRAVVAFTLGSVGGVGWRQLLLATPLGVGGIIAAWFWGRTLDVLLSGDEEASTLGVNVAEVRRWTVIWVAVLTAAAVTVGGNLIFVGLIVPHAARPLVGVLHRQLVPASAFMGGTFLVACDLLARTLPVRSEIPLGVITGIVGAPVFLVLLARAQRELALG